MTQTAQKIGNERPVSGKIISLGDYTQNAQSVSGKSPKLKKDGTPKKTHSNKIKGKSGEVYAFKSQDEIDSIFSVLNHKIETASTPLKRYQACRNKLMFSIGLNVGIRASDLAVVKWNFFFEQTENGLEFKDFYVIRPEKTKSHNKFVKLFFNLAVKKAINDFIAEYPIKNFDDYLFSTQKSSVPTTQHVENVVKNTAIEAGIKRPIGSHSLRKTWGFWCWHNAQDKSKALVVLQQCFNHSSTLTTQRYIGIMDKEISDMFNSVSFGDVGDINFG